MSASVKDLIEYFFTGRWQLFKRELRFLFQKYTRGWDDSDLWNLDRVVILHTLPRLKRYRELCFGHPCCFDSQEEWWEVLDHIIWSFEQHLKDDYLSHLLDKEDRDKVEKGFKLFGEYLPGMWF